MIDLVVVVLVVSSLAICLAAVVAFTIVCPPAGIGTVFFAVLLYRKVKVRT